MADFPFNPGTPEMTEALEWLRVDPAHALALFENLAAYIEQDPNCPWQLKRWVAAGQQRVFDEADPEKTADAILIGLGFKLEGKPQKAPGPGTVKQYFDSQLRHFNGYDSPTALAIARTARHFNVAKSTVYARLAEYEEMMEAYHDICRGEF